MIIRQPPFLKKGDTIGIVCPAGFMDYAKAATCISVLEKWGFRVKTGATLGGTSTTYFSGTDEERLKDLQQMLNDDGVQAVLCGRGGYGMGRIIDRIDFSKFKKRPKWVIGYSDITIFHSHIYTNFKISGLHSPMAAAFNDGEYKNKYIRSLHAALTGKKASYKARRSKYNRHGQATGELIGGNLSLLVTAVGTKSDLQTKGKILFVEDVGEEKYSIDRMLYQLKRSGKLAHLAGIVFGRFTDVGDTTRPFGQEVYEILWNVVREYDYPVCFDFPVSHEKENYALKVGGTYRLAVGKEGVTLKEA
ncbi:LD-carboxypeptidase [Niabella ginsenosidivorans]|uniref:LD-carboxypeptidase n=1 Tax=Niabella ginsenosidivorans TaxID=1176587 RepID=A0A1A9HXH1_9BACT|nr:LD-carboxypeptidase [Niabella ginsenosidivorans]ANH79933.1 LD-carboxypeptidase [Niabella ginsenosidivorans]